LDWGGRGMDAGSTSVPIPGLRRPGCPYDGRVATGRSVDTATATPTMTALRARRDEILRVAAAHGASNVRVFGSVARGTAESMSDIDLLVDFEAGRTLVDHVGLWRDLEALLGTTVDVVSAGGLTDRDDDIRADALAL
jgi:predicted nucleotidyltransferase